MTDSTVQPSDPIDVLGWFSTRVLNSLRREGIRTVGDLIEQTPTDITDIRNLGHGALREIQQKLGDNGLALRAEEPPTP